VADQCDEGYNKKHAREITVKSTGQAIPSATYGMRVGEKRAVRAKYPNGDPETAASFCVIPLGSIASPGVCVHVFFTCDNVDLNCSVASPGVHAHVLFTCDNVDLNGSVASPGVRAHVFCVRDGCLSIHPAVDEWNLVLDHHNALRVACLSENRPGLYL
jgi:hypothetical protein